MSANPFPHTAITRNPLGVVVSLCLLLYGLLVGLTNGIFVGVYLRLMGCNRKISSVAMKSALVATMFACSMAYRAALLASAFF